MSVYSPSPSTALRHCWSATSQALTNQCAQCLWLKTGPPRWTGWLWVAHGRLCMDQWSSDWQLRSSWVTVTPMAVLYKQERKTSLSCGVRALRFRNGASWIIKSRQFRLDRFISLQLWLCLCWNLWCGKCWSGAVTITNAYCSNIYYNYCAEYSIPMIDVTVFLFLLHFYLFHCRWKDTWWKAHPSSKCSLDSFKSFGLCFSCDYLFIFCIKVLLHIGRSHLLLYFSKSELLPL